MIFVSFKLSDGALTDFLHSCDLEVVFEDSVFGELFKTSWVVFALNDVVLVEFLVSALA